MYDKLKTYSLAIIALSLLGQTIFMVSSGRSSSFNNNFTDDTKPKEPLPEANIPIIENMDDFKTQTNKEYSDNLPKTSIKFDEMSYDFGDITEGEVVKHVFNFTNTGDKPLVIKKATGSCGCTVPDWPKEAIAPNKSGKIVVSYNSKSRKGIKTNTVTVLANTQPASNQLAIKANVLENPDKKSVEINNVKIVE